MSPEIKTYLELVVLTFEARLRGRGVNAAYSKNGWLRGWEQKLYDEAKRLLKSPVNADFAEAERRCLGQRWHCRRCDADVENGRCNCKTSPSPWELVTPGQGCTGPGDQGRVGT